MLNASDANFDSLVTLLREGSVAVLTGAGVSTASGIPDYRGPETRRRARNPIRFAQFVGDAEWRQRYWARSFVGWRRVASARPNDAHTALAQLEAQGHLTGLITQNVDSLHRHAGSHHVIELHGRLADVICLACGRTEGRRALQARLEQANPDWKGTAQGHAPDGDADVFDDAIRSFQPVDCAQCNGALKPDVVFFGEAVPRQRVTAATATVEQARSLLVVGSSLTVFSGFRFVRQAHRAGKPVVIVNQGSTRGDALSSFRIDADAGAVLRRAVDAITHSS